MNQTPSHPHSKDDITLSHILLEKVFSVFDWDGGDFLVSSCFLSLDLAI